MSKQEARPYEPSEERIVLQQEFLEFVDSIRKPVIGELPKLSDHVNHEGYISVVESPFPEDEKPHLLLEPKTLAELRQYGAGKMPDRISFDHRSLLGIGKGDSQRKVSFGMADLAWFEHQGMSRQILLAVKPFSWPQSQRTMLHETALFEHCEESGIKSPRVFGLARYGNKGALLTYFEPDLTTLDNLSWSDLTPEEEAYHLHTAVNGLASLHENGIFHGDSEFKNIAFSQQRGDTFAVDLEFTVSVAGLTDYEKLITESAKKLSNDLRSIRTSMERANLLTGNEVEKLEQFHRKFLLPYYERITKGATSYTGSLVEAYDRVVKAFTAEAYGEDFTHILKGLGSFAVK